ncbi:MAG: SoxR reducing system RseC family protein, partial [Clostridiales bacterium]|nr:SoxR reducing system RseC family protein [Clostridiales bacterium]
MTESCRVKKVRRGIIYVELNKSQKCDGCKMCAFGKNNTIVLPALCDLPVQVGQTVTVRMPAQSAGNAALLIYAVPLLTMLIGALIGLVGEWQLQLGLAAAGLVVG